jgi:hypothetical protein
VSAPEQTIPGVCAFIGIDYSPEMLIPGEDELGDVEIHAHHQNVRSEISTASIGKWRNTFNEAEREYLARRMGRLLKRFEYV